MKIIKRNGREVNFNPTKIITRLKGQADGLKVNPDEMGIGPVYAIPKLLERNNLSMDDIGLWELNEAFAVQVVYCRDKLGIPNELLNVNGGAISIGHPYGMSGARMVGGQPAVLDAGQACRVRRSPNGPLT